MSEKYNQYDVLAERLEFFQGKTVRELSDEELHEFMAIRNYQKELVDRVYNHTRETVRGVMKAITDSEMFQEVREAHQDYRELIGLKERE